MKRPLRRHLTDTVAKTARPLSDDRDLLIWDTGTPRRPTDCVAGFGLQVKPSGRALWILRYRNQDGRERRYTLGAWPEMRAATARGEAEEARSRVVNDGIDIQEERVKERRVRRAGLEDEGGRVSVETVGDLCEVYLADHAIPNKRPKSAREDGRRIAKHVKPKLGGLKLTETTRAEVLGLHRKVRRDHGGYEANRTVALLKCMFNLAVDWSYLPADFHNPAKIRKGLLYREKRRNTAPKRDELPALIEQIDAEPNPVLRALWHLQMATGLRPSELRERRWNDVDWNSGTLRIEQTKAGDDRVVPLSTHAREILRDLHSNHRVVGSPFVFPSRTQPLVAPVSRSWVHRKWDRVRKAAGLPRVRQHDLRHLVATSLAEAGHAAPVIQQALGHKSIATTLRYIHDVSSPARAALDQMGADLGAVRLRTDASD